MRYRVSEFAKRTLFAIANGKPASRWSEPGRVPYAYLDMRPLKSLERQGLITLNGDMACITETGRQYLQATQA